MNEYLKPFIEKLTSGKFLFTIGSLLVFMILSIQGKLPNDKVMEVVLIVIWAYFNKKPNSGGAV
jgi:hypothetical protein